MDRPVSTRTQASSGAFALVGTRRVAFYALAALTLLIMTAGASLADDVLVFGPKTYLSGQNVTDSFSIANPSGKYLVRVENQGVVNAAVELNGSPVFGPGEFNHAQALLEKQVSLRTGTNTVSVKNHGAGRTTFTLSIVDLDTTPPTITATQAPSPNANGWNNTPVTVTFICSDDESGMATCPAPVTVSTDGNNQQVSGTAVDQAGNKKKITLSLNIDQAPPNMWVSLSPGAPASGVYTGPVTAHFSCSDGLSGLAMPCPADRIITTQGANQTVTGTVTDRAGNQGSVTSRPFTIGTSGPTITVTLTPPANADGWNKSPVTAHFTCSDGGVGLATPCPPDQVVSNEGDDLFVTGSVTDKAGHTASVTSAHFKIDKTSPTITATVIPVTAGPAGPAGSGGPGAGATVTNPANWFKTDVLVTFTCGDSRSGIKVCPAPITVSTEGANQIIGGTAADRAGNTATATVSVNIDRSAPVVTATTTPTLNPGGWANQAVVVTFAATDALSGIKPGSVTPPMLVPDGTNRSVTGQATDNAGNVGTLTVGPINIDRTRPTITVALSPAANAKGYRNTPVVAHFTCADTGSGIAVCPDDQAFTAGVMGQTVTGTAIDRAGNTATVTSGFFNIDKTPPDISVMLSASPNANGWFTGEVTATFACSDSGIGVRVCPPPVTVTGQGANQVSGTAIDFAGNTATAKATINIDTAPPTIVVTLSPAANANGWRNTPVTAHFVCSDAASGIAAGACPADQIVTTDGVDLTVSGTVMDIAGFSASVTSASFSIDQTLPTITVALTPAPGAGGVYTGPVTAHFTCTDAGSGFLSADPCPDQVVSAIGANQTITGTVTDKAGNTASVTSTPFTITIVSGTAFVTDLGSRVQCADPTLPVNMCELYYNYEHSLPFSFPFGTPPTPQISVASIASPATVKIYSGQVELADGGLITPFFTGGTLLPDPDNPASGLFVNDQLPGRFVVTWFQEINDAGSVQGPTTVQLVLFEDGRIQFGYGAVTDPDYAQVSLSPSDAISVAPVDFSTSPTLPPHTAVYEDFFKIGLPFDLADGFVLFSPNDGGGYGVGRVPDLTAPSCSILSPADGSNLFAGDAIKVSVLASDDVMVAKVQLESSDGSLHTDLLTSPYAADFVVPKGVAHVTFTATAFDLTGRAGVCTATAAIVAALPPPPTVSVSTPRTEGSWIEGATIPINVQPDSVVSIASVDLIVNGAIVATDITSPFQFKFTVPRGVGTITLQASAHDTNGQTGTSTSRLVSVVADPLTTVTGVAVDSTNAPVNGAAVYADLSGASAEIFNLSASVPPLPNLSTRLPDQVLVVSALNLLNPSGVFGADPFGFGPGPGHAIRYSATLHTSVGGVYAFKMGVHVGGQLLVNGTLVVDLPIAGDAFQEAGGSITLAAGNFPIQVLTFDNGNPEVRLQYAPPGEDWQVVPTEVLTPGVARYRATSTATGTFNVPNVPTVFGPIGATAYLSTNVGSLSASASPVTPVAGGLTDVGAIILPRSGDTGEHAPGYVFETNLGTALHCDDPTVPVAQCEVYYFSHRDLPVGSAVGSLDIFSGQVETSAGGLLTPFFTGGVLLPDPNTPASGLYINDQLPGRVVVTWYKELDDSADTAVPTTVQLTLFSDGRIQFAYGDTEDPDDAEVAFSPVDANVNAPVDFSMSPTVPAHTAVFEDFFKVGLPFDLANGFVLFTPDGFGGYTVGNHP